MMEEMMKKMMSDMKPEEMEKMMHEMMDSCLSSMSDEDRKKMLASCNKLIGEMEEKYL